MLSEKAFGLSMGIVNGAWMAAFAWLAGSTGFGKGLVEVTAKMYPGYDSTFKGGLVGGVYGFLTGWVFGWGMGKLYNALQRGEMAGAGPRRMEAEVTPPMGGL